MPISEGRCPNCGSILQLDADAAKGHCLFCDAVFDSEQAFAIAADPEAIIFPNLPQPKYEGPSLDLDLQEKSGGSGQGRPKKQKKQKPAPPPVYVPKEPVKLPNIRVPGRIKLRILLISLAVILLIVAITVPIVMKRDSVRQQLLTSVDELALFSLDAEKDVAIWYTANNYLMAATDDPVTREEMTAFFMAFCEKRAELNGLDPTDFARVYGHVTVKLVHPDGGYLIRQPQSFDDLLEGRAVTVLP